MTRSATLLLVLLLAGCSSPPGTQPAGDGTLAGDASPSASSVVVSAPESMTDSPFGAVTGTVRDGNGTLLEGVRVGLVSVAQESVTDNLGEFIIDTLEPGPYVLRAQKARYQPAATPLQIVAGGSTTVDVVLVPDMESEPVLVDFWQGRDRVQVMDGDFLGKDDPLANSCLANGPGGAARWEGPPLLRFDGPHQLVWPGTAAIEVVLDWSEQAYSGDEMLVTWKPHPDGGWAYSELTPKGQTIRFDVDAEAADSVHQRFTAWQFAVCTKDQSDTPEQQSKDLDGVVHAKMTLVRGHPLPLREAEADLWGNATRLLLVDETRHFAADDPTSDFFWYYAGPCNGAFDRRTRVSTPPGSVEPQEAIDDTWVFHMFEGLLVPSGTVRIEARLEWAYGPVATNAPDIFLSYRGADVAPWALPDHALEQVPEPIEESRGVRVYSFTVDPALTDGADDVQTAWRFYWNMEAPTVCSGLDVRLVAEAIRAS